MDPAALSALSPVDGRYREGCRRPACGAVGKRTDSRANPHRSRLAAGPRRIRAPVLSQPLPDSVRQLAASLALEPGEDAAAAVKAIEARINHDVKAVEYFVREKLAQSRRHARRARAGALRLHLRGHQQPRVRAHAARRAHAAVRRAREAHRHGCAASRTNTRPCRCCRAPTARRRARPRSARSSPTSSRACGAPARASTRWRSSPSGMAPWATTTRTSPRFPRSTGRRSAAASSNRRASPGTNTPRRSSRTTGSANTATRSPPSTSSSSTSRATPGATSRSATCASAPLPAKWARRPCRTR